MRKGSQTNRMGKAWQIGSHTFSIKWVLFSIRFPSCGILYHMVNTWVFSSISHSMGKDRKSLGNLFRGISCKTHRMGRTWVWVLFSHWIPILCNTSSHGKCMSFHQFPITWEKTAKPIEWGKPGKLVPGNILQNPSYGENLENC